VRQLRHFCKVVRGEESPRITGFDATKTLVVIQAIQEAARTGGKVNVAQR
jgi:hypothetical protein